MSLRILIAADGSEFTQRAARYVAEHLEWYAAPPEIHLFHVQPPLPYPGAQAYAGKDAVRAYQQEESEAALAVARRELESRKVACVAAWRVGDIVTELDGYIRQNGIDFAVLGSHGKGAVASLVLGSVAQKCIARLEVPILIIRK